VVRERPLRPDNGRIVKIEQAAKAYALRIVGVSPWDTWEGDEALAEAADESSEVAAQIDRALQAHLANPANRIPGLLPHDHAAYDDCYRLFNNLHINLHELATSTARDWPYYSLAEAFAALTELTATLPRCGVEDTAPLRGWCINPRVGLDVRWIDGHGLDMSIPDSQR
jgi:hypothetical protein